LLFACTEEEEMRSNLYADSYKSGAQAAGATHVQAQLEALRRKWDSFRARTQWHLIGGVDLGDKTREMDEVTEEVRR
jgi:hypothetical protein